MSNAKTITAAEFDADFDADFDAGEDTSDHFDWSAAHRPNQKAKRVNVDFPHWVVAGLDAEARTLGVTRQAPLKMGIAERLRAGA